MTPAEYRRVEAIEDEAGRLSLLVEPKDALWLIQKLREAVPPVWEPAGGGCTCLVNPNPWAHYGAVEPGDALEPDPDCPHHFPEG